MSVTRWPFHQKWPLLIGRGLYLENGGQDKGGRTNVKNNLGGLMCAM